MKRKVTRLPVFDEGLKGAEDGTFAAHRVSLAQTHISDAHNREKIFFSKKKEAKNKIPYYTENCDPCEIITKEDEVVPACLTSTAG